MSRLLTGVEIFQVCSSPSWGGMEMHAADLARWLLKRGHRVHALSSPATPFARRVKEMGIPCTEIAFGGYFQPTAVRKLKKLFARHRSKILHCHYGKDLWTIVPALGKGNSTTPLFLTKHIGTQKPKRDLFHRYLYRRVDRILANSSVIYRNVVATHPVPADRVSLLHLGIDENKFFPAPERRKLARKELGFHDQDFIVGISSRLQRWKGHYEFIEMAAAIGERYPDTRFLVIGGATVGEEHEAEAIRQFAREKKLGERLIFTGFREDVPVILNALDLFVFPSYAEAYGLALIEAMASGLPVIASNCDGVLDLVSHEQNGLLIPPRNVQALTAAVQRMIEQPALRASLARNALTTFRSKFTATIMMEQLEKLYDQVLTKRQR